MKVAFPLAKNVLAPLAIIASASAINGAVQRRMYGRAVARVGKGITLVFSNEAVDDIVRIIDH